MDITRRNHLATIGGALLAANPLAAATTHDHPDTTETRRC